jgi:penicillin-binding protein 1A
MRTALRLSSNRAAVRLLQEIGIPHTVQYARTLGVGDVPSVPSLALGSGEVTLDRMTAAYAAFINAGKVPLPLLIRRVEDRGGVILYEAVEVLTPAVSETTAFLMSSMLSDVINAGTAARARSLGFTLPAAGKTGTTNEYRDSWFIGFTPRIATGVWVGFDQPRSIIQRGFASEIAVPIWANFMKAATRGDRPTWIRAPRSIVSAQVCSVSGMRAGEGCEHAEIQTEDGETRRRSPVYTEYFVSGTEPTAVCNRHSTRGLLGAIASLFGGGEPPAAAVVLPAAPAPAASAPPAAERREETAEAPEEPPRRRRGFWSRLFGIGSDDDRERDEDEQADEEREDRENDRRRPRPRPIPGTR